MPYDCIYARYKRDCGEERKPDTDPTQGDEEEHLRGYALGLASLSSRLEDWVTTQVPGAHGLLEAEGIHSADG